MSYENQPVAAALPAVAAGASPSGGETVPARAPSGAAGRRVSLRTRSLMGVQILSCGSYLPELVVTNEELATRFGFDADWITQRSGILARRHALPDQATSDLCVEAARKAIRNARVNPQEIDLLVVGTFTPDHGIPSTACLVQERLDLDCGAMDVQAACAGFMYALATAAQFVATGNSKLALVIGGDCNSRVTNPLDQRTAPLFGDGAGAVLLAAGDQQQGLLCYQLGADGSGGPMLDRKSGGSRRPPNVADIEQGLHYLQMDGRNVFKWAVNTVTSTIRLVLEKSGVRPVGLAPPVVRRAAVTVTHWRTGTATAVGPGRQGVLPAVTVVGHDNDSTFHLSMLLGRGGHKHRTVLRLLVPRMWWRSQILCGHTFL